MDHKGHATNSKDATNPLITQPPLHYFLSLYLLLRLRHLRRLRHPHQPIHRNRTKDIEDHKRNHDAEVAPAVRVDGADAREEGVGVGHGAEAAVGRRAAVEDVAAGLGDVLRHVVAAGLAGGWLEVQVLDVGADDGRVGEAGGDHAGYEVGKGADAVHEDPEAGEDGGGGEDTGEG